MKIIDKINVAIEGKRTFFSFEFFPPRTDEGVENLFDRLDRMAVHGPTFCDITWGAGGTTSGLTLGIASKMQNLIGVETMMHLTCTNMPVEQIENALTETKKQGIQNILALRGDPPKGQEKFEVVQGGFACALDLVKHIRKQYGKHYGIGVAGYPEAHPDSIVEDPVQMEKNYMADIMYLKEKVEAGADFIVTQLFYDPELYVKFVKDCRSVGIQVPILPGIMPIVTYAGFKRMTGFCKTFVPKKVSDTLESIKDHDEAVKNYGVDLAVDMCKRLLESGCPGLHIYTLNLERSALGILERLGLIDTSRVPRVLPWRAPSTAKRLEENVRPIFWSNRPKSYMSRTSTWDSYPSGRWGNARSPAYGTLSDYQFMRRHTSSENRRAKARQSWGEQLSSMEDVKAVFIKYCQGDVPLLPWSEMDSNLHAESKLILEQLVKLNAAGYLTINSQPQVNAASSTDAAVGWGGPGGYVYQKAYVEFFTSPELFQALKTKLDTVTSLTYIAVNATGELHSNMKSDSVNAVTWGVFPGQEIIQPTVVDPHSFTVWKDEAFDLWLIEWGNLYPQDSDSHKLLKSIHDTWYLVSVVDNDFIKGDLFGVFETA